MCNALDINTIISQFGMNKVHIYLHLHAWSPLIAETFSGIPTVNLLRGIPCSLDIKSSGCPAPPSYVPRFFTGYTDTMTFKQRVVNTLVSIVLADPQIYLSRGTSCWVIVVSSLSVASVSSQWYSEPSSRWYLSSFRTQPWTPCRGGARGALAPAEICPWNASVLSVLI